MVDQVKPIDVAIVIIAYNSAETIERSVRSVLNFSPTRYSWRLFVVDNASDDRTLTILDRLEDQITLIRNSKNIGFGPANNLVLNQCSAKYFYLHNADAYLQENVLDGILDYLDKKPAVGIAGLPLVYPDHSPQTSAYAFATPAKWLLQLLGVDRIIRWIVRTPRLARFTNLFAKTRLGKTYVTTHRADTPAPTQPQQVDWVCGAAMVIRDKTCAALNGFDPQIFLYSEDQDLCRRARTSGWEVEQLPVRPVIHDFGWGKHRTASKKVAELKYASLVYYVDKHFRTKRIKWLTMRALLWLKRRYWA